MLLNIFFIFLLIAAQLNCYEYFDDIPDDGTRELAIAHETYQEHLFKSVDYTINQGTPGFIRKSVSNVRLFNDNRGKHVVAPIFSYKWIDGQPVETGGKLDFCINGNNKAFFTILLHHGLIGFTRDGRFRRDFEGKLVTLSGNFPVLGENGIITIPNESDILISRNGNIFAGNDTVDRLKITVFKHFSDMNEYLHSINGSIFTLSQEIDVLTGDEHYALMQGFIMQSNSFKSYDSKFFTAYSQLAVNSTYLIIDAKKTVFRAISQ